ncbi:hypothetical protein HZ996_08735 [Cryomorphaceae bacterium]|nr:hypothetical protein HZ996_08735 [Cryomorphaceae bacterium]
MKLLTTLLLFMFCAYGAMAQQPPREFELEEGDTTYIMKSYVLCLLKAGPNRDHDSATAATLQEGHLAHFNRLAEEGKIAMVGPMGDDTDLRGIIIFDVGTVEEARELESMDPMIQAGRLVMELHPWWTAKGSCLP